MPGRTSPGMDRLQDPTRDAYQEGRQELRDQGPDETFITCPKDSPGPESTSYLRLWRLGPSETRGGCIAKIMDVLGKTGLDKFLQGTKWSETGVGREVTLKVSTMGAAQIKKALKPSMSA
jgi:hypothetical protein